MFFCHHLRNFILANVDLSLNTEREIDPFVDVEEDGECEKQCPEGSCDS